MLAGTAREAEAFAKTAVIAGTGRAFGLLDRPGVLGVLLLTDARRDPRDPGDGAMAAVKFRGLDSRTELARWGLAAVAIGIVVGGTAAVGGPRHLGRRGRRTPRACVWLFERLFAFWPTSPWPAR